MSDRLVLALDGSTGVCSAALLRAGAGPEAACWDVLASRSDADGRGQSRVLLRLVDEMLDEVGAMPSDLGEIVVGIGPGTFTGVRIAVATARGLAVALTLPVFGVSTLKALAVCAIAHASEEERAVWSSVIPVIDARRQQVFFAVYEALGPCGRCDAPRWTLRRAIEARDKGVFTESLGTEEMRGAVVIADDQGLVGELPLGVRFHACEVKAEYLVTGQDWLLEGVAESGVAETREEAEAQALVGTPEAVKPLYVRAPDADIHITKMKDPWADGRDGR